MRVLFLTLLVTVAAVLTWGPPAQAANTVVARIGFNLRSDTKLDSSQVGFITAAQQLKDVCVSPGTTWHAVYRPGVTVGEWVTGFAPADNLSGDLTTRQCVWEQDSFRIATTLRRGPDYNAVRSSGGARPVNSRIFTACYLFTSGAWDLVWAPGVTEGVGWTPSANLNGFGTTTTC
jgi:hypothetical protein